MPSSLLGTGMQHMLFNMIQEADIDLRPAFYQHIVLSGMPPISSYHPFVSPVSHV
jgi:hypothetical protein